MPYVKYHTFWHAMQFSWNFRWKLSLICRPPEVGVMVWNIVPSTGEDHTVMNPAQHHTPHHHNYICCEGYTSGRVSSSVVATLKIVTTKHVKILTYVQHTRQLNPDVQKQLQTKGFKTFKACKGKLEGCSSKVPTAVLLMFEVFCDVILCHWEHCPGHFKGSWCLIMTPPSKRHKVNTHKHSTTFQNICIITLEGLGNFSNNNYTENGYAVYLRPQHFRLTSKTCAVRTGLHFKKLTVQQTYLSVCKD